MGRKRKKLLYLNRFYGDPVETIAEWCQVSKGTAEHYKAGRREPSPQALKLFRLFHDQEVLGPEWEGYRVVGDKLFTPDNRCIRQVDIVLLTLLWQALAEADSKKYHELLEKAASF